MFIYCCVGTFSPACSALGIPAPSAPQTFSLASSQGSRLPVAGPSSGGGTARTAKRRKTAGVRRTSSSRTQVRAEPLLDDNPSGGAVLPAETRNPKSPGKRVAPQLGDPGSGPSELRHILELLFQCQTGLWALSTGHRALYPLQCQVMPSPVCPSSSAGGTERTGLSDSSLSTAQPRPGQQRLFFVWWLV